MNTPIAVHPMVSAAAVLLIATSAVVQTSRVMTEAWRAADPSNAVAIEIEWTGRSVADGQNPGTALQRMLPDSVPFRLYAAGPIYETERNQRIVR